MNSRDRFRKTMAYGPVDRAPYFEEGIRDDVIAAWQEQGLTSRTELNRRFPVDPREELEIDLEPRPKPGKWPCRTSDLDDFRRRFDPDDPARLPEGWPAGIERRGENRPAVMLRIHRGFFLSMGVYGWQRFAELMRLTVTDAAFVRDAMALVGEFAAALAEKVLARTPVDAAIFSEPIGGNDRPLLSPAMYADLVLHSYRPLFDTLRRHNVPVVIFRTYANARIYIPMLLDRGFNCLWACEVDTAAMDYRDLRREYGRDLRLIGGIDLDTLRTGKDAIRREITEKVPPLLADGGYAPLADGRVRADVPFAHYAYYRELLESLMLAG